MARVLGNLKVMEISGVDRGAGEGTEVLLMKREGPPMDSLGGELWKAASAVKLTDDLRALEVALKAVAKAAGQAMPGAAMREPEVPDEDQSQRDAHAARFRQIVQDTARTRRISESEAITQVLAEPGEGRDHLERSIAKSRAANG
jgi:hypothetical protein